MTDLDEHLDVDSADTTLSEMDLDETFTEVDENTPDSAPDDRPERHSPEWTDYVLNLLTKNELVKDRPRSDGLVRLVRMLIGEVGFQLCVHHVSPDYAAVTCNIIVAGEVVAHGSAECSEHNTDAPYNKYPLATAETRAIGRAAKRLLGLSNILTAEEDSDVAQLTVPESTEDRTEGSITDTQIKFIARMCKKLDIDVCMTIAWIVGDHEHIGELSHAEALQVNSTLDGYTRDENKEYAKLSPFKKDWRTTFVK